MEDLKEGNLQQDPFAPLIWRMMDGAKSGTLRLEREGIIKVIYLQNGTVAFASSNAAEDRLGNVLINQGKLTAEQLQQAQERMQPGVSLGKTLVNIGFITSKELIWSVNAQVRQVIFTLFNWTDGHFSFLEGSLPKDLVNLQLDSRRLFTDGVLQMQNREQLLAQVGGTEAVVTAEAGSVDRLTEFGLGPEWGPALGLADGSRSMHEIAAALPQDDFTVAKMLYALQVMGFVALQPGSGAPVPAPPPVGEDLLASQLRAPAGGPVSPEPGRHDLVSRDAASPQERDKELLVMEEPSPEKRGSLRRRSGKKSKDGTLIFNRLEGEKVRMFWNLLRSPRTFLIVVLVAGLMLGGYHAYGYLMARLGNLSDNNIVEGTLPPPPDLDAPTPELPPADPGPPPGDGESPTSAPPDGERPPGEEPPPVEVPVEEPPPVEPPADEPPPPVPPPVSSGGGSLTIPGQAPAFAAFQEGNFAQAGRTWKQALAREPAGRYIIQIEIACQVKSIQRTFTELQNSPDAYFIPFTFRRRPCFKVGYGIFRTRREAEAAFRAMPEFFQKLSNKPVVTTLGRFLR